MKQVMNKLVSIVILTKNAGPKFNETLDAIYKQSIGINIEVIVVDSGSTDETLGILKDYNVGLYQIKPGDFNFGLTRNYAFSLANGEFIVTISQDVIPCDTFWLKNIIAPFYENDKVVAVKGHVKIPENNNVFYWEKVGMFYFTSESVTWVKNYKHGLSFVNCAIRKIFWENNQIPYCIYSEDKLFQKKIINDGKIVFFVKDAICYHGHQYSLKSLLARLINEGLGWQYVGVSYGLIDCLKDIYDNKWMIKKSIQSYINKEFCTFEELIFPLLRPICIYYGNRKNI